MDLSNKYWAMALYFTTKTAVYHTAINVKDFVRNSGLLMAMNVTHPTFILNIAQAASVSEMYSVLARCSVCPSS